MEAPKCKLCGERHYGLCAVAAAMRMNAEIPPTVKRLIEKAAKFDRNAYHRDYMREYMRKRRAKEKK